MAFAWSVVASILGTAIGVGVTISCKYLRPWFVLRGARKIWSPFLAGDALVVVTGRKGGLERSTTKVSVCELRGLQSLQRLFATSNQQFVTATSLETQLNDCAEGNVILLGSQNANNTTRLITEKMPMRARLSYDTNGNVCIGDQCFPAEPIDGSPLKSDHAVIVKCPNPFQPERKVLLIAGNHGAATQGAVEFLTNTRSLNKVARLVSRMDFVIVLNITVDGNTPKDTSIVYWCKYEVLQK